MAQVLVLYNTPADPAAFDSYYFEHACSIANKIPGLRSNDVSHGPVQSIAGGSAPHLVDHADVRLGWPISRGTRVNQKGQATAADLPNFASGGATDPDVRPQDGLEHA